ncbi:MAG: hypothetical protein DI531_03195 [Brevundimonas sp.]|uniref:hypothetical protein n=1 Tax=Brevundimonas sp. TaxID=1871086 RepID=UPI000DB0C55F|nr:hypothetical protein [Brevundimonas sp.]PZU76292.1 MAG: hypothetical protein DI531_03195 [Brevundimonas sp.]
MSNELSPAIALLEGKLRTLEQQAAELRSTINFLRKEAGQPALPDSPSAEATGATVTQIRPDTFYGKKLQTAVREYLEMRKAQGLGPAKPREIYDAITAGGFEFEASSPDVALIGLRAMMRKRTQFFHKLPNGTYGMTSWYPHAKSQKSTAPSSTEPDEDDDAADAETAPSDVEEAV